MKSNKKVAQVVNIATKKEIKMKNSAAKKSAAKKTVAKKTAKPSKLQRAQARLVKLEKTIAKYEARRQNRLKMLASLKSLVAKMKKSA